MIDKKDIYKNLEFASKAYSVAEGAFPLWEAVFALVVGQLLIAYFSSHVHNDQKIGLAILGLILSTVWFILVGLNYLNAKFIDRKMLKLRDCLNACDASTTFIWPWPDKIDKEKWTLWVILTGQLPEQERRSKSDSQLDKKSQILKSIWIYRKALPSILILVWLFLMAWQIQIHLVRSCGI
jgi:hypothetical protein